MLKATTTQIVDVRFKFVNQKTYVICLESICVKIEDLIRKEILKWRLSKGNLSPNAGKFVKEWVKIMEKSAKKYALKI
ncbi:hypothetical protein EHP00_1497 [Ecytonucleospora hepatopenaei]|uniref:Uncharacterized protein n=1 Tax=Ecytonucleospora hepatopenaei TaxID=646526 RepID=A0A1W0E3M8_9MICR|nr:hypothetical protein EHP00_1497 [Ecytonucleospora hepatopenaei]